MDSNANADINKKNVSHQCSHSFPPLEQVTRPTVPTDQGAYYCNRQPQTLRAWACFENGPIKPIRINGRLAWPVDAIRKLLDTNELEGGE